eukprot:IDg7698t1
MYMMSISARSLKRAFYALNETRKRVGPGRMRWHGSHRVDVSFSFRRVSGVTAFLSVSCYDALCEPVKDYARDELLAIEDIQPHQCSIVGIRVVGCGQALIRNFKMDVEPRETCFEMVRYCIGIIISLVRGATFIQLAL